MSIPIALGLYSVRDLYKEDFAQCLKRTAALGYTGVECFGAPTLPAWQVNEAVEASGMALVGWHMPIELLEGEALKTSSAYFHEVGNKRAVIPWMPPETFASRDGILAFAQRLNEIERLLSAEGIALGYHNHGAEFVPLADGTIPWALLMDNTSIFAQLDSGNALSSGTPGLDMAEYVAKWPGRGQTIHLKPYSARHGFETMIGEDDINWPAFLRAAETAAKTEWFIIEYEEEKVLGQFEGAEKCLSALKNILK